MPKWVQPLLSGRGWTPALRAMYHRKVGRFRTCGIELEFNKLEYIFHEEVLNLVDKLHKAGATRWQRSSTSSVPELTCLFDLTNPVRLRRDVRQHYLALLSLGVGFSGGLHINYVLQPDESRLMAVYSETSIRVDRKYDFEGPGAFRIEFKGGRPTILWEDLLLQMVLGAYTHGKSIVETEPSDIQIPLPKGKKLYSIYG